MYYKIKKFFKFIFLPLLLICVIMLFFPVADPLFGFMSRIAAHKYMKDTYNQNISVQEVEGNFAAYINHGPYMYVYCSLEEYPDFEFTVTVKRGTLSVSGCSYEKQVFEYAAMKDISLPLSEAFGEKVNYNYDWIYPPGKNSFNAFSDFNSEILAGIDINDAAVSDFESIADGCKINIYANTLSENYRPDYEKIYNFTEYYKNILPGKECDFTIRLKTKSGLSSYEVSFSLDEINDASDVKSIIGIQ